MAKVDVVKEISYADLCINLERQEVTRNGEPVKLSPKEYNLLVYLVENAEKVVSRVEIAEKVWNTHFDTGTNFTDVYINYLRKKMDKNFEVKLIHTKPGSWFYLDGQDVTNQTDKPNKNLNKTRKKRDMKIRTALPLNTPALRQPYFCFAWCSFTWSANIPETRLSSETRKAKALPRPISSWPDR